jgi:hypothetical protein
VPCRLAVPSAKGTTFLSENDDLHRLIQLNKQPRGLNDFWYWKEKQIAEIGVARKVLSIVGEDVEDLRSCPVGDDPPDCEALIGGVRCGIEMTEFMHEATLEATMQGTPQFFLWVREDFLTELQARIDRKDSVAIKGGPYERYILILFSDEICLTRENVETFLQDSCFQTRLITDAFFALSYDPTSQSYPVFKLSLIRHSPPVRSRSS